MTAIDKAIAGSTQRGDTCVQPKVASISVMEWPIVKAVTVRSNTHQTLTVWPDEAAPDTARGTAPKRLRRKGSTSASRNARWSYPSSKCCIPRRT